MTGPIPRQRSGHESGTEDEFAGLGLGGSLALTGLLAAVKIAETATGVVLTAAGVLPGTGNPGNPGNLGNPKERPPAWSGGE